MTVYEARLAVLGMGGTLQARTHVKLLRELAVSTGRDCYAREAAEMESTIDLADGVSQSLRAIQGRQEDTVECQAGDGARGQAEPQQADLFGGGL